MPRKVPPFRPGVHTPRAPAGLPFTQCASVFRTRRGPGLTRRGPEAQSTGLRPLQLSAIKVHSSALRVHHERHYDAELHTEQHGPWTVAHAALAGSRDRGLFRGHGHGSLPSKRAALSGRGHPGPRPRFARGRGRSPVPVPDLSGIRVGRGTLPRARPRPRFAETGDQAVVLEYPKGVEVCPGLVP